jgi:hypothetical protein
VTKKLLSQRIGKGSQLWTNETEVELIVEQCTKQGSRFIGEIVRKLLKIEYEDRLTAIGLCNLLGNCKRAVGVYASPEWWPNGRPISSREVLPLMPEMGALQKAIGEKDCYLSPGATIENVTEDIKFYHPIIWAFSGHATANGIVLQDEKGVYASLDIDAFKKILHQHCTRLKYLILNACNTEALGRAAVEVLPHLQVVCWRTVVEKNAAKAFDTGMFDNLADQGACFADAFAAGETAFTDGDFAFGDPNSVHVKVRIAGTTDDMAAAIIIGETADGKYKIKYDSDDLPNAAEVVKTEVVRRFHGVVCFITAQSVAVERAAGAASTAAAAAAAFSCRAKVVADETKSTDEAKKWHTLEYTTATEGIRPSSCDWQWIDRWHWKQWRSQYASLEEAEQAVAKACYLKQAFAAAFADVASVAAAVASVAAAFADVKRAAAAASAEGCRAKAETNEILDDARGWLWMKPLVRLLLAKQTSHGVEIVDRTLTGLHVRKNIRRALGLGSGDLGLVLKEDPQVEEILGHNDQQEITSPRMSHDRWSECQETIHATTIHRLEVELKRAMDDGSVNHLLTFAPSTAQITQALT